MKEARGVLLAEGETTAQLAEWHMLICQCAKCPHVGRLYWSHIATRVGRSIPMASLYRRLRCRACGNGRGNIATIEMMPRD